MNCSSIGMTLPGPSEQRVLTRTPPDRDGRNRQDVAQSGCVPRLEWDRTFDLLSVYLASVILRLNWGRQETVCFQPGERKSGHANIQVQEAEALRQGLAPRIEVRAASSSAFSTPTLRYLTAFPFTGDHRTTEARPRRVRDRSLSSYAKPVPQPAATVVQLPDHRCEWAGATCQDTARQKRVPSIQRSCRPGCR